MSLTACRILVLCVGVFLTLIAIFGEPIREAINFPTGPSHPGFGPTQWTLLVVGAVVFAIGLFVPAWVCDPIERMLKRPDRSK